MSIEHQLRGRPTGITLSHFEFDYELLDDSGAFNPGITVKGALPWQPIRDVMQKFDVLRFMNWQKTNVTAEFHRPPETLEDLKARNNRPNWRTEAKKEAIGRFRWTITKGVPLPVCIKMAAACWAHPWLNIPHGANVAEFDRMLRYTVDLTTGELARNGASALTPIYEYSNEVWNSGRFRQQDEIANLKLKRAVSAAFGAAEGGAKLRSALDWQVECTNAIANLVQDRAFVVLGAQAGNHWVAQQLLEQPVSEYVDALAIAPYVGHVVEAAWRDPDLPNGFHPLRNWQTGEVNVDLKWPYERIEAQLAINLRSYIDVKLTKAFERHKALIDRANSRRARPLRFWTYEGGLDLHYHPARYAGFDQQATQAAFMRFSRSAAAGQIQEHMMNTFRAHGGELFVGYSSATAYDRNDYFGHIDLQYDAATNDYTTYYATPRLAALIR